MVEDRKCLILYSTAVCNLNCVYCYIDKSDVLKQLDNILDESFQGDYYFNFTKKMFPNPQQLEEIQIWGGEPTIRLDRTYYTIEKCIEHYTNLRDFMFSTNFTGDHWFDQFLGFCDIFRKFPDRKFCLNLQLSIDGPTELNDSQRGQGVTKEFTEHFIKFIECKKENKYPNNLRINFFFKQTLSSYSIPLLQDKELIINYYKFFEQYKDASIFYEDDNFNFSLTVPNTATPSPHTKEEGKMFANLCKLCREIEKENLKNQIFKYYRSITPLAPRDINKSYLNCPNIKEGCGHCGMATRNVGLLPNNRVSLCHNGFVDLLEDYKLKSDKQADLIERALDKELFSRNLDIRDTNCSIEEFAVFEKIAKRYELRDGSTFQLAQLVSLIMYLAYGNLIDSKYKNKEAAVEAARFIQNSTSYCIRDNIASTGSAAGYPMGLIKLLLNGAKEYCEDVQHLV